MSKIEITTVPLSKLVPSKSNVRRFQSEAGLTELCASIRSHGLLQNLTVRKNDKGKYEVVAGARRLAALTMLAKEEGGLIAKHTPIPVHLLDDQNDTEVSLAENTVRENMHVADQVEAFRKLIEEEGMTAETVGDRYGFTADQTCIRINAVKSERPLNTHDDDNMAVFFARREQREKLQALVPKERADLFDWCMQADQATLLAMLAFCVADQIDGTASSANATNARQADKIAEVIGLDMAKWWKPSEGFFKRITKKMIAGAASDVGVPREVIAGILDAPKSDAIRIASDAMEGKGWVPPLMRTRSVPVLPEAANDDAAASMIAAE